MTTPPTAALARLDPAPRAWMETAIDVAREAGKLVMSELPLGRFPADGVEEKTAGELVSRMDKASEALIARRLLEAFPDHAVLGEEGGRQGAEDATCEWIVDPIDGTVNFIHGHPFFSVSIAVRRGPHIEAGAVYLPYLGESYYAARGHGAFLNSDSIRLRASDTTDLDDAMVATGFAYDRTCYPNHDNFVRVAQRARAMRRCGSAAIDLCFVAAGRYDAYWELGLKPWDLAAGALLVQEAGGEITDLDGGQDWLHGGHLVCAGTKQLAEDLRGLVERGDGHPKATTSG